MKNIEILKKIVKYKTNGNEQGINRCVNYIKKVLSKNGWKTLLIKNNENKKNNLIAVLNGELSNLNNAILLAGHIDTVVANKDKWESDPYILTERDENLYGLGVADMKAFTSIILANLNSINKINTNKPIVFVLTNDEETVMYGVNRVVDYLKENNINLSYAIIGEPSSCNFATSNMGFYEFETTINGKACHSSNPQFGINSIYIMSKVVTYIESLANEYLSQGTTINVGIINGGTMCNIVAENCSIRWDVRTFSREVLQEIQNKVDAFLNNLTKEYLGSSCTNKIVFKIPAFSYVKNETTENLMTKFNIQEMSYSAATEAGFYQELGANCVIFGCGDIKDCHKVNEKINKEEYLNYQQLLLNILKDICK